MVEIISGVFIVSVFLLVFTFMVTVTGFAEGEYKFGCYGLVAFVVLGIIALSCVPTINHSTEVHAQERQEERESVRQEGRKAYRLGVPANANPYQGNRLRGEDASRWLEGWMQAKEEEATK